MSKETSAQTMPSEIKMNLYKEMLYCSVGLPAPGYITFLNKIIMIYFHSSTVSRSLHLHFLDIQLGRKKELHATLFQIFSPSLIFMSTF